MQILIKGARVIDPGNMDQTGDILVEDGRFKAVCDPNQAGDMPENLKIIDARGMVAVPGLIDIHVHLREPGQEYKETIETGLKAAAKGGFTAVCSMPNTSPVNDSSQVTEFIINQGKKAKASKVYPTGAISLGSKGESLAEIHDMVRAGIKAVTDDGLPVESSQLMRRAMEYCQGLDIPIFVHAEDKSLVNGGSMNEGPRATLMGIKGIPNISESVMVSRDIALAGLTCARVHFCHISTAESIEAIRLAKAKGISVTCETAPHYFTLTDEDITEYDSNFKMNPPLRSEEDKKAVIQGLCDGTIDLIASDHAPHHRDEKEVEFDKAAFGIVGLETSLPLSLKLVQDGFLSLSDLVDKMSKAPAKILGINNDIAPGNRADLTLIDLDAENVIDPENFISKSANTPFSGRKVQGEAVLTMVDGKIVFQKNK